MTELNSKTMNELTQLVEDTEDIDETGDASFGRYVEETYPDKHELSFRDIVLDYLNWANGPSGDPRDHQ